MMITKLRVENFKSLREVELDFRKITLLLGPNNSGKSSVLQLLAFLKQSVEERKFKYKGRYVDVGDFKDFIFKHEIIRELKIKITIDFEDEDIRPILEGLKGTAFSHFDLTKITYDCAYLSEYGKIIDYNWSKLLDAKDRTIIGYKLYPGEQQSYKPEILKDFSIRPDPHSFLITLSGGPSDVFDLYGPFEVLQRDIFTKRLHFLKTARGIVDRSQAIPGSNPESVGSQGEMTIPTIAYNRDDPKFSEAFKNINKWVKNYGFEKVTPRLVEGLATSLELFDAALKVQNNVIDVGFGINQLLSVITQCFFAPKHSLIMIEEPEVHLHPKKQAELADFFIEVKNYGQQLIITTHSEHLLARFQRRIAEENLDPNDIIIYYFSKGEKGTEYEEIELDEMGNLTKELKGFFEEDFKDIFGRLQATAKRIKKRKPKEKESGDAMSDH